jgi:hypothetical protein
MNDALVAALAALLLAAAPNFSSPPQSGRVRATPQSQAPAQTPEPAPQAAPQTVAVEPTPDPNAPKPPPGVNASYTVKYEGGSLGLEKGDKVTFDVTNDSLTFTTKKAKYAVQTEQVNDISYGQSVKNRTAAAIGIGVIVPAAGDAIGKSKSTAHYIEIIWDGQPTGGIAFRVDKDDYRGLIAALEGATGLRVRREPVLPIKDWP